MGRRFEGVEGVIKVTLYMYRSTSFTADEWVDEVSSVTPHDP